MDIKVLFDEMYDYACGGRIGRLEEKCALLERRIAQIERKQNITDFPKNEYGEPIQQAGYCINGDEWGDRTP